MPHFDIVKQSNISNSFRVKKIQADFDVKPEHSTEHFKGEIIMPDNWSIGVIVGGSGTGKSSIANELFKNELVKQFEYNSESVIDDMPKNCSVDDISKMFYAVVLVLFRRGLNLITF